MKPYPKHDYIQNRDLLPRERLEPVRDGVRQMRVMLNSLEGTLSNASDALTESDLSTICEAVQMAYNAVENAAMLGWSDFSPRPVRAVGWNGKPADAAPNILIRVAGGMVQGVSCNIPGATCWVLDDDALEAEADEDAETGADDAGKQTAEFECLCASPEYTGIY